MTRLEDRQTLASDITEAHAAGARLAPACTLAGLDLRTLQRWRGGDGDVLADRRPDALRPTSPQALSDDNAFAEALFRTAKYRPGFPADGFADLEAARRWRAAMLPRIRRAHDEANPPDA